MTDQKILEVLDRYDKHLSHVLSQEATPDGYINKEEIPGHLKSMIPKIRGYLAEGRREKAFRWLGFMQGVLWRQGVYSLNDLKNHNRP